MASEPTDGNFHEEVRTVAIRIFGSHDAANLAAAKLEAYGIRCWLNADDAGGMYPNLAMANGVRLLVRASDADAATALLDAPASPEEINQIETEAAASSPPEAAPLKKLTPWQILSGIFIGVILCLLYQQAKNIGTKTFYYHDKTGKAYEADVYRNGHLVECVKDRNLDGHWDEWIYYENGHVIRLASDNNFDGKPDEWVAYSNGSPTTLEKDGDFNGTPDEFVTFKDGVLHQMEVRPNGAKFATQRWLYQNGVLVEILRGGDSSGHFKEAVSYDPFFNPIPAGFKPIGTNTVPFPLLSSPK